MAGGMAADTHSLNDIASLRDRAWQTAFRLGFPLARVWWRLWRRPHEGALVAVYVGNALLLVRSSYRAGWTFPGGGVRRGEPPEAAARRELAEETGLVAATLRPAGVTLGFYDGRPDRVHFFELLLDQLPALRLDNRETIAARLVQPGELRGLALTGSVVAYLDKLRHRAVR
jgi:8-oxo-dGTP pyrophosphatase MutT (NUDIX family)